MHKTCAKLDLGFSPSSTAFSLATITSMEVSNIVTSFLTFISLLWILVGIMAFLFIVEALDMGDIFFFLLGSKIDICCKWVLASSLSSSMPRTSMVFMVFFQVGGESLVSRIRKWLFFISCVSRGGVGGLILFGVFLLFFCGPDLSETSWIYFAGISKWL